MKTLIENWKELFTDQLNEQEMLRVRGGDGENENPNPPILK